MGRYRLAVRWKAGIVKSSIFRTNGHFNQNERTFQVKRAHVSLEMSVRFWALLMSYFSMGLSNSFQFSNPLSRLTT